jgi:hypothetical protein
VADPDDRSADAEILWEDEADVASESPATPNAATLTPPEPTAERAPRAPKTRVKTEEAATGAEKKRQPRASTRPPAEAGGEHPRESGRRMADGVIAEPAPRTRSSGRAGRHPVLIVAAVVLLVIGSIAFRTWRSSRQQLPEVARIGRDEGIPALEEGKFDKAYQLLSTARNAVDALGGDVEGADEIRHAADEAALFVDLLSDSLETMLDEAARKPLEWPTRFNNLYKGRAVIIEATIIATPESGGAGRYEIDYMVLPSGEGAGEQRFGRLDVSDLEVITLADRKVGDHVPFGARLASFQYDKDRESFVIRFEPKSGVMISHNKALEALGWPTRTAILDESTEGAEER